MRIPLLLAWCALATAGGASLEAQPDRSRDCGDTFGGFDSRLGVDLVGLLPTDAPPVIGFEVTAAGPVIATKNTLYAVTPDRMVALPLTPEIRGISADAEGRLALQSAEGVSLVRPAGLEPIAAWKSALEGVVTNSGAETFLEHVSANGTTIFGARLPANNRVLPIAHLDGALRAAAWDERGLIAIVGEQLVRWRPAANVLERLVADTGLREATGVCGLSDDRVLVTLRNATLLFSSQSMTVVAAAGGLCRAAGSDVWLLDPRLKRLWKVRDMDALGDPARDRAHATRLLQLAVTQDVSFTRTHEFSEAVRLVGCSAAHRIAGELQR